MMNEINTLSSGAPLNSSAGARTSVTSTNGTIRDLLTRLPVKFLILFTSVCRTWSGLLGRSILDHVHYNSNKNPLLIIQRFHWDQQSCGLELFLFEIRSKKIQELHVPRVTDSDMGFKIVGSCNGLICVCHYSHDPSSCLFLWNPATRQIKRILEHSDALLPHNAPPYCLLGFVYNARANDYEVVRIYPSKSSIVGIHALQIERYSLNAGFWKEVEYSNHHGATVKGPFVWVENSVTVKRKMFWVAMTTNQGFSHEFIVSFDAENNILRKMSVPSFDNFDVSKKLTEYGESLGMLILSESATRDRCLELWIYDGKCNDFDRWIKTKTIGLFSNIDRPVGVWKDEVFIASGNVIRSAGSGLKALLPSAQVADDCSYVSMNYAESLAAVNGGNKNQLNEEDEYGNSKEGISFLRAFKKLINDRLLNKLNARRLKRAVLKSLTKSFSNMIFYFRKFFGCVRIL